MRKILKQLLFSNAVLTILLQLRPVLGQDTSRFEGVITFAMTMPQLGDQNYESLASIKGDKMMMTTDLGPMGSMQIYSDKVKHTHVMVMSMSKTAIETDDSKGKLTSTGDTMVISTANTQTINGYTTREFDGNSASGAIKIWASADVPASVRDALFWDHSNPGAGDSRIYLLLQEKGLAPIRTIKVTNSGTLTVDFVKFENKKIDDSVFEIPADIKVTRTTPGNTSGH
jgi:hypothetical protein